MGGLSYEVENYAQKGMEGLSSAAGTAASMTKQQEVKREGPGKTAGGALGAALPMGLAGAQIAGSGLFAGGVTAAGAGAGAGVAAAGASAGSATAVGAAGGSMAGPIGAGIGALVGIGAYLLS